MWFHLIIELAQESEAVLDFFEVMPKALIMRLEIVPIVSDRILTDKTLNIK